jgi:hypothetical protein
MGDALGLGGPVERLVGLLRVLLLDMVARQLDLDDVRAEQGGHVRGIGADIEGEFAFLAELAAARIGPDHGGDADRLGLGRHFADLFHHLEDVVGTGIDGEADRAQPRRRASSTVPVTA